MEEPDALTLAHLGELKLCSLETTVASLGKTVGSSRCGLRDANVDNFTSLRGGQDITDTNTGRVSVVSGPRMPAAGVYGEERG